MADIFNLLEKIKRGGDTPSAPVLRSAQISYIIAGLGNPGPKYAYTRHNAGFLALDYAAQKMEARVDRVKFKSFCGEAQIGGIRTLLLKPQTFMNLSGDAVREAAAFYKIPPERILIIFDDINFEPGRLRVRESGSDGGHNGIKDIILKLGSDKFPRIKIGVGRKPHPDYDLAAWVTSEFNETDKKLIFDCFSRVYDALTPLMAGNFSEAANRLQNMENNRQKAEDK